MPPLTLIAATITRNAPVRSTFAASATEPVLRSADMLRYVVESATSMAQSTRTDASPPRA